MSKEKKRNIILYSINSQCNDNCIFCIKSEFRKKPHYILTLKEIQENYLFLKNKYQIKHIVLSGGEPTLHNDFFKIIDFFNKEKIGVNVVTNLLKINENAFFKNFRKYFPCNGDNMIIASINDLPFYSNNAKLRIKGFNKILKSKLKFILTILIYKDNIKNLAELAELLGNNIKKYYKSKREIEIELRSLYFSETPKSILKKVLPDNNYIKPAINNFLDYWQRLGLNVNILIWRFPLCYVNNFDRVNIGALMARKNSIYFLVDKNQQLENIKKTEIIEDDMMCPECILNNICAAKNYLIYRKKYNLPLLKPFKKSLN